MAVQEYYAALDGLKDQLCALADGIGCQQQALNAAADDNRF